MKRKFIFLTLLIYCLIVGLLMPQLFSVIQDARLENSFIPLTSNEHYAYRGTLLNRVLAWTASLNHSPVVECYTDKEGFVPEELWTQLSEVLPLSADYTSADASTLLILPRQYNAEYWFTQIDYAAENMTMHVTADAETLLPVYIELHTSADVMTEFAEKHSMYSILDEYAAVLNLGKTSGDGSNNISTVMRSETDSLRGAPFTVTVTILPSAGTLILKLEGVPST